MNFQRLVYSYEIQTKHIKTSVYKSYVALRITDLLPIFLVCALLDIESIIHFICRS